MARSLDLTVLPVFRQAGQDQSELPGLYLAQPPRRPARSRSADRLVLYLALTGNSPLSPGKIEQILSRLAKTYYDTSGSVTAALRAVADNVNHFLLDRNLKNASTGQQAIGLLTQIVFRDEGFYLAQSGPVHAFFISAGQARHFFDPSLTGRGLGLSRSTTLRFSQAALQPGDILLLASQPSPAWSASTLGDLQGQTPEILQRRLLRRADLDLNAVIIQARPGPGKYHLMRVAPRPAPEAEAAPKEPAPVENDQPVVAEPQPAGKAPDVIILPPPVRATPVTTITSADSKDIQPAGASTAGASAGSPELAPESVPPPAADIKEVTLGQVAPAFGPATLVVEPARAAGYQPEAATPAGEPDAQAAASATAPATAPASAPATAPTRVRPRTGPNPLRRLGRAIIWPFAALFGSIGRAIGWLFRRMLPGEALLSIPGSTMAFVAIAVPLVVVSVASMVYLQRGRAGQYNGWFAQAQQAAAQASGQADPLAQWQGYHQAIDSLNQAEGYVVTQQSQALRIAVQEELDRLDLVKRAAFKPAIIGGLPDTAIISRMLIISGDLYLLDSAGGNVLRATDAGESGYALDTTFQCGASFPGGYAIQKLVGIVPALPGNGEAVLTAFDMQGNYLKCLPGAAPRPGSLKQPPTAVNWGSLVAFTIDMDTGHLYVLDPQDSAIWAYWYSKFDEDPQFFFGDEVPAIQDAIDLAVNRTEMYILHADGHMSLCNFSNLGVAPTRCNDPVPYVDYRVGRESLPFTPSSPFNQIHYSIPPNPSLYFLEPQTHGIYHFSLRSLGFQRQFLPSSPLPENAATAFAVNPLDRLLFLAIGNRVYYGSMP